MNPTVKAIYILSINLNVSWSYQWKDLPDDIWGEAIMRDHLDIKWLVKRLLNYLRDEKRESTC